MVDSAATEVKKTAISALVAAETISVLGTRMTYLALPWFVLVTTGSPGKMSLVLAAEILPMAVLGIPSGALVQHGCHQATLPGTGVAVHVQMPALPGDEFRSALGVEASQAHEALIGVALAIGSWAFERESILTRMA